MNSDPIRGQTIHFTFTDGPMAKKTFEHIFDTKGTVSFRMVGGDASSSAGARRHLIRSTRARWSGRISGPFPTLGSGGYTLTTVLDFKTKKLVAFSSNEKGVSVQHGTFEYAEAAMPARTSTAHAPH